MFSETISGDADKITGAGNRIQAGPIPEWVSERSYDASFKARPGDNFTYLLFDRQVHAERRADFFHSAVRLENMDAVQRYSQWRLEFEPGTQSVTLHFIRVRRDQNEIEHLNIQKGRLLEREAELNHFTIDGWFTFLLILDDIRAGDILECAYTVVSTPRLLPEHSFHYCGFPAWVPIGKYRFSCLFDPARPMKWKSFWKTTPPTETTVANLTQWTWSGENHAGLKPEPNTPRWYLGSPWVQVSDCPDWSSVAGAIQDTWATQSQAGQLEELAGKIEKETADVAGRIEQAVQFIQDEFRYLSVNLEFGGQTPTAPHVVLHRRYGDCKDLSFLLANLLQRLGITARPILVNAVLTKTVNELLPAPGVFNHAILEVEAEGQRRWIDPTLKHQGGGAFNRPVHEYGFGLPVGPNITALVEAPKKSRQPDLYELHETLLLDTTGADTLLSATTRAVGSYAETLRQQFAQTPLEDLAKERLQRFADRYGYAKRVGTLQFRDDRSANQFVVVEVFEINRCYTTHRQPDTLGFPIPNWWLRSTLPIPEKGERQTPFALPFPCQLVHIVDVEFPSFQPPMVSRYGKQNEFLKFNRAHKVGHQFWVMTFSLDMAADAVLPGEIQKYREAAEEIWKASSVTLLLPIGYPHVRKKKGFGELPPAPRPRFASPQPMTPRPVVVPAEPASAKAPVEDQTVSAPKPRPMSKPSAAYSKPTPAAMDRPRKHETRSSSKPKAGFWQRLFGG